MGKLTQFTAIALALQTSSAAANPLDRWADQIREAGARFGLPEEWIREVMRAESGGATVFQGRSIVSSAGAMGLMQLMPGTWRDMRSALALGTDPFNPRDNILAGAAYLRLMYNRFGYPGLFAAYNAGPGRYHSSLVSGRALPAETRVYAFRVTKRAGWPEMTLAWRRPSLFILGSGTSQQAPNTPRAMELFVQLGSADVLQAERGPTQDR